MEQEASAVSVPPTLDPIFSEQANHTPQTGLQQFYAEDSIVVENDGDGDDVLFETLYGRQDPAAAIPQDNDQPESILNIDKELAENVERKVATEDGGPAVLSEDETSGESSEDESDDESGQDVKIVLIGSSDASKPATVRVAPNKYVRSESQDGAVVPAKSDETVSIKQDIDQPKPKTQQRAVGDLIPEMPPPIDTSGRIITFPTVYDVDIDALPEKPWKHAMADPSDWFNYGFDEDSWRTYCQRQVQMRLSVTKPKRIRAPDRTLAGVGPPGPDGRPRNVPPMASVPPAHRPPQAVSADVLELGGGSRFAEPEPVDSRPRTPRENGQPQRPRDAREFRDVRETRDPNARDPREVRDRDVRGHRESRDGRDSRDTYRSAERRDVPASRSQHLPHRERDKRTRSPSRDPHSDAKRRR